MQYPQVQFTYDTGRPPTSPPPPGPRAAGGPEFRSALGKFFRNPLVRTGSFALAGMPIAFEAVNELNQDPGNTVGNISGAAGELGGGFAGGLVGAKLVGALGAKLGALGGPLAPLTVPLGFAVGSYLGGGAGSTLARGVANAVTGMTNDELGKTIRDQERMARSAIAMEAERGLAQMPVLELQAALQQQQLNEDMARRLRAQGIGLYQQAMLGPSMVPAGAYMDPNFSNAMASIASRALG